MDFKVAGTSEGVTALQMDIKIEGINEKIMEVALEQALHARLHILGQMNEVIAEARTEVNVNAPSMIALKVDTDKIRDIIGKGGATIRGITEQTGATVARCPASRAPVGRGSARGARHAAPCRSPATRATTARAESRGSPPPTRVTPG